MTVCEFQIRQRGFVDERDGRDPERITPVAPDRAQVTQGAASAAASKSKEASHRSRAPTWIALTSTDRRATRNSRIGCRAFTRT
jgi:hypothetical protein